MLAKEELGAVGDSHQRWTVTIGGEAALVLGGMPGQDPIRRVYVAHGGLLHTLSFSPDMPDNPNAQMEPLFSSVTPSWVWISSGSACTGRRLPWGMRGAEEINWPVRIKSALVTAVPRAKDEPGVD